MNYIVIEMQTGEDGKTSVLKDSFAARNDAESKYHTVLSYAAKSGLPMHAASLMQSDGRLIECRCYEVLPEPEEPSDNPSPTLGGAE